MTETAQNKAPTDPRPAAAAPPGAVVPRRILWYAVLVILIAGNLRPVFPSLAALLPEIMAALDMSAAQASYLTTLPVICLGILAPLAPVMARRRGVERTMFWALLLLTLGSALRLVESFWVLLLASAMAGTAIAIGNVLLPGLVKRDFPRHMALMTGLYTTFLCAGAACAAVLTVPLARATEWNMALAAWALPAALVALFWGVHLRRLPAHQPAAPAPQRPAAVWRDPLSWQLTGLMGLQSALAYCVFGWLAPIMRSRGMDAGMAGVMVSVSIVVQMVACLFVPHFVVRCRDQRWIASVLALFAGGALLGLLYLPLSLAWFWMVIQGLGQGGLIALAMTFIVLRAADSAVASRLSGMAQGGGYILAALGPLLVGLLLEWTGSYASSGWLFGGLALGVAITGWGAGQGRVVRA